jgi:hypothetical protein
MKDVNATVEASSHQKRTSSTLSLMFSLEGYRLLLENEKLIT